MQNELIDLDSALARLRGNKALYRKMLGMFLASTEPALLEESLNANDYAKAGDLAHAIKGMTGNLSLNAVFESSTKLMNECRGGEPSLETVEDYRLAYEQTVAAVQAFINDFDSGAQA